MSDEKEKEAALGPPVNMHLRMQSLDLAVKTAGNKSHYDVLTAANDYYKFLTGVTTS